MTAQDVQPKTESGVATTGNSTSITADTLPSPDTKRWVVRRKVEVVAAVRAGLLTLEQACQRYHLTIEEFQSWQAMIERHGVRGLRVTRIQQSRKINRRTKRHDPASTP